MFAPRAARRLELWRAARALGLLCCTSASPLLAQQSPAAPTAPAPGTQPAPTQAPSTPSAAEQPAAPDGSALPPEQTSELEPLGESPVAEPVFEAEAEAVEGELGAAEPVETELVEGDPVEVTVVGARVRRAPGAVHLLPEQTLKRYGYDDVHAALQLVPGVYVRQEDGVGLRPNIGIRGALSDRSKKITLLEDGVPFAPAPYSAPAAYYFPMLPRMVQLRVIKGPAAISHGPQTIGGAIDFISRPIPSAPEGMLDVAFGQYGYARLHGHAGMSDQSGNGFLIEGVHLQSDGFKRLPSEQDTGFYRNEWTFKGLHDFDPSSPMVHQIGLKLTYSEEVSNETYLGLSDADFRREPLGRYPASALDRMSWTRTSVVLSHRIEPTSRLSIHTDVYRHDFQRAWRKVNHFRGADLFQVLSNPDTPQNSLYLSLLQGNADASSSAEALYIGPNERQFVSHGVQSRFKLELDTGPLAHRIEYGLRLHEDRIERRHSEDAYALVGGRLLPEGSPTLVTAFNEASSQALAFHALDAISVGPWTLTPGLRVELIRSSFTDKIAGSEQGSATQVLLPGIGSFVTLVDNLGFLAGVYRGMSPPPPGAEPQIDPEISLNYEAGLRYQERGQRAELIGYYNDYDNLTDVCTFSTGCVNENLDRQFEAGRARIYGLEAALETELRWQQVRLPLSASYTLTQTEFLESFESQDPIFGRVSRGDEMPYVPRHEGRVNVAVELEQVGGYVSGSYVSRMREQAGSGPLDEALTTDALFTLDVGAHYQLPEPRLRLYAHVRNLLDEHALVSRRPYGARPNAPRWLQVGAQLEF